jgi:5-dehydro-2-deoxygluconokinase
VTYRAPKHATELEAVVMGRVCVDLYPMQLRVPLEQVEGFHKYVGGFAGNVATGLARLGVRTAIVSAVGDDGHGRYVRDWLTAQGVDCRWLGTHPTLRTALAFCEAWPPDNFPITFYRTPTCPDWELAVSSLDLEALAAVPLAYVSGTGFAIEPSRLATQSLLEARAGGNGTTVLDLDWRAVLWDDPVDYAACMRDAARHAGVALGSDEELVAAVGTADASRLLDLGVSVVANKHGGRGVTVYVAGQEPVAVPPHPVEVVNGLGAGDAFAAAFGWRLLRGDQPAAAAAVANRAGAHVAARLGCSIAMPTEGDLS